MGSLNIVFSNPNSTFSATRHTRSAILRHITPTAKNKAVAWNSSDDKIATVDNTGKVTAIAAGEATITAAIGDIKDNCKVTVNVPITGVNLDKTTLTLLKGETGTITATVLPADATIKEIKWTKNGTLDDTTTKSVDVKATVAGQVNITVSVTTTDNTSKTATCAVMVFEQTFIGRYTTTYSNNESKSITETIEISKDLLKIYDNNKTGSDLEFLNFSITKWETATTPNSPTDYRKDYPTAYKITGRITGANPITTTGTNSLYGPSTATGFTQSDIKTGTAAGTECWMYIYIANDGKFIRTPFSKTGTDNGTGPVTSALVRAYTKAP